MSNSDAASVSGFEELTVRDLVAAQIRIAFVGSVLFVKYLKAVVIIVCAVTRIVIVFDFEACPARIDGNESGKKAVVYHMQSRKNALVAVLGVADKPLYSDEVITRDDTFMMILHSVLIAVMTVLFRLVRKIIRRECLACQNVSAVPFILQDLKYASGRPDDIAAFCGSA